MPSNLLDIFVDATSGYITLPNPVPKQTVILRGYKLKFASAANSVTNIAVKFEAPFFRGNNFMSGKNTSNTTYTHSDNPGITLFTINNAETTVVCNIPIELTDEIPESFSYKIESFSSTVVGFTSLTLLFSYEIGGVA